MEENAPNLGNLLVCNWQGEKDFSHFAGSGKAHLHSGIWDTECKLLLACLQSDCTRILVFFFELFWLIYRACASLLPVLPVPQLPTMKRAAPPLPLWEWIRMHLCPLLISTMSSRSSIKIISSWKLVLCTPMPGLVLHLVIERIGNRVWTILG